MQTSNLSNLKIDSDSDVEMDFIDEDMDTETLTQIIMDLSKSNKTRLKAIEIHYYNVGDKVMEFISILTGMYSMSGTSILESFLHLCCTHGDLSAFVKLQCAKSLLSYKEFDENSDDEDTETDIAWKVAENKRIEERNEKRVEVGYEALDYACYSLDKMSTPCRVEAIFLLMMDKGHKKGANVYFGELVEEQSINCDYRYKTILTIENKDNVENKLFFMCEAFLKFLINTNNDIYYRILAGQYLVNNSSEVKDKISVIENILYGFASNTDVEYNRRADSADILLRSANNKMVINAQQIITELAEVGGKARTIFENAQNVHTEQVEQSVSIALEALSKIPLLKIKGTETEIDFEYVKKKIFNLILDHKRYINNVGGGDWSNSIDKCCKYCSIELGENEEEFCTEECALYDVKEESIKTALNRIFIDRSLYSKFNNTLTMILLKIWTYTNISEHKETMHERLLDELHEMSGTCSSGFATRLINVISGFGEFNIRISWEDQIVSNFMGRLNALSRKITDENSVYYTTSLPDVVERWLATHEDIKKDIDTSLRKSDSLEHNVPMKEIVEEFLNNDKFYPDLKNRKEKVDACVVEFSNNVIVEMAVVNSDWKERLNLMLFFRTSLSPLREELYNEFKTYVSDGEFELYMRKAIMTYEGEV